MATQQSRKPKTGEGVAVARGKSSRLRMTAEQARQRAVGKIDGKKFDNVALLRALS